MKEILQKSISDANNLIASASDEELQSGNFKLIVFSKAQIQSPALDTNSVKIVIDHEIITPRTQLIGVSQFTINQPMSYVVINVPVIDPSRVLALISPNFWAGQKLSYSNTSISYKQHSSYQIEGNDNVINGIKSNAKSRFDIIQNIIDTFESEREAFNENELKPHIIVAIENEIKRREQKANSIDKLNPFK